MSAARGIWVWLELEGGALEGVSLELLGKGRELAKVAGEPLVGLVLADRTAGPAADALRHGADEVVALEHPLLARYTTDAYTTAVADAVANHRPNILLLGATHNGRDLAGRLAVRLRTGLTADCTNLEIEKAADGALLLGEVTGFGGGIAAMIACRTARPQMATVRPGVFPPGAVVGEAAAGRIRTVTPALEASAIRTEILERHIAPQADLTSAKRLVVVGRGSRGNLDPARQLASRLGAELGATRVAVDEGWIEKERMVGQTGYVTRPEVAVACGVSGALQFMVGIHHADVVVAINADPEAPIFEQADYGICGDLFQVVPALVEALK